MAKGTISRKQLLKEPDQFISFSGRLIAFGRSHRNAILIGAGCILALLLIATAVNHLTERKERQAADAYRRLLAAYAAVREAGDPKTAYERISADAEAYFERFGGTQAAKLARITVGDISYEGGDADTAIRMYRHALDEIGETSALKPVILNGLGHAHMAKGNDAEAIRYFEMIVSDDEKTLQAGALFNLAHLYAAAGNAAKSDAAYQRLLTEFPDSLYRDVVTEAVGG